MRSHVHRALSACKSEGWLRVAAALAALAVLSQLYATTGYHKKSVPRGHGEYAPYLAVQDGHKMYLQAMSLVYDWDLDISNQVQSFGYVGYRWKTESGRPIYPHGIGPVIVWSPFLGVAHVLSRGANILGAEIPDHGYTPFHQRIVFFSSVLFAWLTALIGYGLTRKLISGRLAPPLAALATLFGTNLYYYAVERPDLTHAMSAFAVALCLAYWGSTIGRRDWRRCVLFGVLVGGAALIRSANGFFGVVLGVELLAALPGALRKEGQRGLLEIVRAGGLAFAACFGVFSIQLLVWRFHYESGFAPPHGSDYVHLGRPMLSEFLFSSLNGYWSTHPLAYLGALGLVLAPGRLRLIAASLGLALTIQVYINSCVYDWWGMGSYGARRMCGSSLIVLFGLACFLHRSNLVLRRVPAALRVALGGALLLWFVVWNLAYAGPARTRRAVKPLEICCEEVPSAMASIAEPIFERFGNPFALPASWLFSLKWDVPVGAWDAVVTNVYAARPNYHSLDKPAARARRYPWNIPGVNFQRYILGGLGPRQAFALPESEVSSKRKTAHMRWTTRPDARIFVPLFMPSEHVFRLKVHPNVGVGEELPITVLVNGQVVLEERLSSGWRRIEFRAGAGVLNRGINVVTFRSEPRPGKGAAELPALPGGGSTGVALRMMRIEVVEPRR